MRITISLLITCCLILTSGCATAISPAREAYIQSKPHGWIELSISDLLVPARPSQESDKPNNVYPPTCSMVLNINNENYLSEYLPVVGNSEPYSITTGFRVVVPIGLSEIKLTYTGCKVENNKLKNYIVNVSTEIREGLVSSVKFDGINLSVGEIEKNTSATLETLDARLKNIEEGIKLLK